jgi:hypothetical protein
MRADPVEAVQCAIQILGKGYADVMIVVVDPSKAIRLMARPNLFGSI